MHNFPDRLAEAIHKSGKAKGALADHVGVALSTVSRWLTGSLPDADKLKRIAEFLEVNPKWLLTGVVPLGESHPKMQESGRPYVVTPPPNTVADVSLESSVARIASALERIAQAMERKPPSP